MSSQSAAAASSVLTVTARIFTDPWFVIDCAPVVVAITKTHAAAFSKIFIPDAIRGYTY
jgi:hypothetical protein